jgi:dTDP-4-amino-4,6-dideoxygalactose transaminase
MGAKIVFADIQEDTGNIDPKAVEAAITSKTKAIVAVDYAGHPADLDELRIIADKYGIYLIEDAAHSIGSTYKGKPVGSIADLTTFSFFPTKNITTAEGGAVASIHPELLLKAKRFSRQGLVKNPDEFLIDGEGFWHQEVHQFGLNYRLPDVLCALGISQLKKIELFKKQRKDIFTNYKSLMNESSSIQLPIQRSYVDPMWHLYPIRVSASNRKYVFDLLRENGIGVQVNYMPANLHPVFAEKTSHNFNLKNSVNYYKEQISLPMHTKLTVTDQEYISETLIRIVSSFK